MPHSSTHNDEDNKGGHGGHGGHGHGHGHGHGSNSTTNEETSTAAVEGSSESSTYSSTYPLPKAEPTVPKEEYSSGFLQREGTAFLAGVMFFTRIRVPSWVSHSMYWLSLSTAYYPLIGVIVGAYGAFYFTLSFWIWGSPLIAAIVYTMSTCHLTGAFHEDGLADMFDGFGGGWTKDSVLRIMRDSRVGTYGCLGLFLCVLLKISAVIHLVEGGVGEFDGALKNVGLTQVVPSTIISDALKMVLTYQQFLVPVLTGIRMLGVFITAHAMGRWSCTYLLWRYPYVENASAKGKEFLLKLTLTRLVLTTISAFFISAFGLCLATFGTFLTASPRVHDEMFEFGALFMGLWVVCVLLMDHMGVRINRVIGGVIGDCLGATNQLVEIASYLAIGVKWADLVTGLIWGYGLVKGGLVSYAAGGNGEL
ncbi:hypothetical protein HDU76_009246 [Blyttiomyces sp. JEL0837]|nr:hypothetical protein HDU76_009246 [Blyttiomyces sp. JEL0837]